MQNCVAGLVVQFDLYYEIHGDKIKRPNPQKKKALSRGSSQSSARIHTRVHAHTCAHTRFHARTQTRTRAHTPAYARARTHAPAYAQHVMRAHTRRARSGACVG